MVSICIAVAALDGADDGAVVTAAAGGGGDWDVVLGDGAGVVGVEAEELVLPNATPVNVVDGRVIVVDTGVGEEGVVGAAVEQLVAVVQVLGPLLLLSPSSGLCSFPLSSPPPSPPLSPLLSVLVSVSPPEPPPPLSPDSSGCSSGSSFSGSWFLGVVLPGDLGVSDSGVAGVSLPVVSPCSPTLPGVSPCSGWVPGRAAVAPVGGAAFRRRIARRSLGELEDGVRPSMIERLVTNGNAHGEREDRKSKEAMV